MRSRKKKGVSKAINSQQMVPPNLWQDNNAERVVQLVAALDFEGAEDAFNKWTGQPFVGPVSEKQEPAAFAAIRAAKDWKPLLSAWINTGKQLEPMDALTLENLLGYYQQYDFGKWLKSFATNLLQLLLRIAQDLIKAQQPALQEQQNKQPLQTATQDTKHKTQAKPAKVAAVKKVADDSKAEDLTEKQMQQLRMAASLQFPIIINISGLLLSSKNAITKTRGQALDLMTLAFKTYFFDGRFSFFLADCYYKNRKKEQAYQQFAFSLLHFAEMPPALMKDLELLKYPPEIAALLKKHPQPAKAVALGVIKGIFKLIDIPQSLCFKNSETQQALLCYQALHHAEQVAHNPRKNIRQLANTRKALMEVDPVIGKEYMKLVKAIENT